MSEILNDFVRKIQTLPIKVGSITPPQQTFIRDFLSEHNEVKNILHNIQKNDSHDQIKKGFYIYGNPGSGKTAFVTSMLNDIGYDFNL